MGDVKVTFLLLTYNQESWVREAVEAALAQDYEPLEIVISDDCSTDQTLEIIKSTVAYYRGPHTVVVSKTPQNQGLSGNLNHAFSLSHGDFIVAASGDDVSSPVRSKLLVSRFLSEENVGVVFSNCRKIDSQGNDLGLLDNSNNWIMAWSLDDYFRKKKILRVNGGTACYDRILFSKYGPFREKIYAEDRILGFRCLLEGKRIVYLREALVNKREHGNNLAINFEKGRTIQEIKKRLSLRRKSVITDAISYLCDASRNESTTKYLDELYRQYLVTKSVATLEEGIGLNTVTAIGSLFRNIRSSEAVDYILDLIACYPSVKRFADELLFRQETANSKRKI